MKTKTLIAIIGSAMLATTASAASGVFVGKSFSNWLHKIQRI